MSISRRGMMAAAGDGGYPYALSGFDEAILATPGLMSYWPMNDPSGTSEILNAVDGEDPITSFTEVTGRSAGGVTSIGVASAQFPMPSAFVGGFGTFAVVFFGQHDNAGASWGWNMTGGDPDSSTTTGWQFKQESTNQARVRGYLGTSAGASQTGSGHEANIFASPGSWIYATIAYDLDGIDTTAGHAAVTANGSGPWPGQVAYSPGNGLTYTGIFCNISNGKRASKFAIFDSMSNAENAAIYAERDA